MENQVKLTEKLEKLTKFLTSNQLAVNPEKTGLSEHMVKQKRARLGGNPPTLTTEDKNGAVKIIKCSKYTKLLGGNFQEYLT